MDNELRKILNRKLGDGGLGEVLPEFDRETLWATLEPGLTPAKRQRIIPIWCKYAAAAILIGVIVGGLGLRQRLELSNSGVFGETAAIAPRNIAGHSPVSTVPVAIINNNQSVKTIEVTDIVREKPRPAHKKSTPETNSIKTYVSTRPPLTPIVSDTSNNITPSNTVAKRAVSQPRAIHLLDLNNDEREVLINPQTKKQSLQNHMSFYGSPKQVVAGRDEPGSVLGLFVR